LPRAFSSQPQGILVNGEKYIFIRNQDNFAVFRKSADGMVIVKLNQGKSKSNKEFRNKIIYSSLYYLNWYQSKTRNVSRSNQQDR
jgi:hypothetical protein